MIYHCSPATAPGILLFEVMAMWSSAKGNTTQRGYGAEHQQARALAVAAYRPGDPCSRCGKPMTGLATTLDLDHTDDRNGYRGLAHRSCNRAAGARKGNRARRTQPTRRRW